MNASRYFQPNPAAILVFLLAVFAAATGSPTPALADCCPSNSGRCADGTWGTPCCGYGKCNIFCCNCDGGCRRGGADGCADKFTAMDLDKNGGISLKEFEAWATEAGRYFETGEDRKKAFENLDANKNGKIDPVEVDKSLTGYKGKAK